MIKFKTPRANKSKYDVIFSRKLLYTKTLPLGLGQVRGRLMSVTPVQDPTGDYLEVVMSIEEQEGLQLDKLKAMKWGQPYFIKWVGAVDEDLKLQNKIDKILGNTHEYVEFVISLRELSKYQGDRPKFSPGELISMDHPLIPNSCRGRRGWVVHLQPRGGFEMTIGVRLQPRGGAETASFTLHASQAGRYFKAVQTGDPIQIDVIGVCEKRTGWVQSIKPQSPTSSNYDITVRLEPRHDWADGAENLRRFYGLPSDTTYAKYVHGIRRSGEMSFPLNYKETTMKIYEGVVVKLDENKKPVEIAKVVAPFLAENDRAAQDAVMVDYAQEKGLTGKDLAGYVVSVRTFQGANSY